MDYRRVFTGILFILRTGIPWHDLLLEMGCGSGMTCWRRLRDWQELGPGESFRRRHVCGTHAPKAKNKRPHRGRPTAREDRSRGQRGWGSRRTA